MISEESPAAGCACGGHDSEADRLRRLDEIIAEYRNKPGGLIPVLQIAQGMFGFLPERVVKHIAHGMDQPLAEVAGVVSFYSFFSTRPRGRHTVRVCLGTACYVRGGKQVLDAIQKELGIGVGETTPDQQFTLEVARCFGACGLAPAIMIDQTVHQRVKPSRVREILAGVRGAAAPASKGDSP